MIQRTSHSTGTEMILSPRALIICFITNVIESIIYQHRFMKLTEDAMSIAALSLTPRWMVIPGTPRDTRVPHSTTERRNKKARISLTRAVGALLLLRPVVEVETILEESITLE